MISKRVVPLSEYHRLPQEESLTADFYKRQLEVVCNNATLALFIMDERQECVYMNPAAEALTGYSLAETQGRALHDVIHHTRPDGRPYPLCECPIDQAFPKNNQEQGEEVFVHKDGHFYSVAYTASPIREGDLVIGTIIEVRDITQEKIAEQARQEAAQREQMLRLEAEAARQRVETILSSISDGVYVLDQNWCYTYVSDRLCEMTGRSREEMLGHTIWEQFPGTAGTDVYVQFHRAMREQTPLQFEFLYEPWNRWFEHRVYPSPDRLTVFAVEITDLKQTELVQVEQKRLLELIALGHPLDECLTALCAAVSKLSPRARACVLLTNIQGTAFPRSITPDFPPSFGAGLKDAPINELCIGTCGEAVYSGQPITCANIAADDRWSQRWRELCVAHGILACHSVPVVGIHNQPLGSLMLCFDQVRMPTDWEHQIASFGIQIASIALERDRANAALRESEIRFRRIFECNMVPMGVWSRSGEILHANDALLNLLGYSRQELEAGQLNWQSLTPPEWVSVDEQALEEVMAGGILAPFEKEFLHKQGHRIPILAGGASFLGDSDSGVFFAIDLTEHKQGEAEREQLLASEQSARAAAEQANRIKDEFLAVLSHELRSPLNPILGWSQLLQQGKLDEERTKQAIATITRNAKLQSELIEDLLDVSRILRGKLRLNVSPVNLASTIEAAVETVRLAAEAKSIQVKTRLNTAVGLVAGDATRLQQIVWNLLSNAVKFTSAGGQVTVQLAQIGNHAEITVADTGKGISPEFLPHVFDYFRQADSATTRQFGGLGLGLAIVRHLVELHGGIIRVESQGEGLGATFTVRVPLMPRQPVVDSNPQVYEQSLSLSGIRVLVVDDDTDTRALIEFSLQEAGAQVRAVASAGEALTVLSAFQPDVILSDIGMPDMDGYMLMRQVRALPPEQGGQTPAIALTAYAGEFDQQQALAAGFQKHISKPIEPDILVGAIALLGQ